MKTEILRALLLVSVSIVRTATGQEQYFQEMDSYCERPGLCHSVNDYTLPVNQRKQSKCCIECSCEDDCIYTRTCCVDRAEPFPGSPVTKNGEICLPVNPKTDSLNKLSFLMVANCPDGFTGPEKEPCLHPNSSELKHFTPVFSKATKLHYRNEFCARCNGDFLTLIQWDLSLKCQKENTYFNFFTEFVLNEQQDEQCSSTWDPPVSFPASPCYHDDYMISDCPPNGTQRSRQLNATDKWRTLCNNYYAPFFGLENIYKNVFCMMCNKDIDVNSCFSVSSQEGTFSFLLGKDAFQSKESSNLPEVVTDAFRRCGSGFTYIKELVCVAINKIKSLYECTCKSLINTCCLQPRLVLKKVSSCTSLRYGENFVCFSDIPKTSL